MKKGQVSIEFLIITGFSFFLIIPVMLLFLTEARDINEDITSVQVQKLADELVDAVNNVYYLGDPTKKTINIYIPKFVQSATFNANQIIINVSTGSSEYIVSRFVAPNLTGSLNTNAGTHTIEISAVGNQVNING